MITEEQKKDLRVLTAEETFVIGGHFYRKEEDGSFSHCQICEGDLVDPDRAHLLRLFTEKFIKEKRLFVRRNSPWASFE